MSKDAPTADEVSRGAPPLRGTGADLWHVTGTVERPSQQIPVIADVDPCSPAVLVDQGPGGLARRGSHHDYHSLRYKGQGRGPIPMEVAA